MSQRYWIQRALDVRRRRMGAGAHHRKSVRVEARHKGALHRMLGVPLGQKIPHALLQEATRFPERFFKSEDAQVLLRRRAQFALNVRGLGRTRHAR